MNSEASKTRRVHSAKALAGSRADRSGSLDRLLGKIEKDLGETAFGPSLRAGSLIRQMRREAGMSQRELADRLGITQARVSELEVGKGKQGPSWEIMERIAKACGREIGLLSPPAQSETESDAALLDRLREEARALKRELAELGSEDAAPLLGNVVSTFSDVDVAEYGDHQLLKVHLPATNRRFKRGATLFLEPIAISDTRHGLNAWSASRDLDLDSA